MTEMKMTRGMLAMTQTRDITGTSRDTSSDMVIGVLPTVIMAHTRSTKVGESCLSWAGLLILMHVNHSYPSGRFFGTSPLLHEAHSQCGSKRLAGVRMLLDVMLLSR